METWKDIPGYEGFYQVSDMGRVKSLSRTIAGKSNSTHKLRGRILIPKKYNKYGHLAVDLSKYGVRKAKKVHALVMLAFVGAYPEGQEIRHLNSDPTDNRLCNLAYGTRAENGIDASKALRLVRKLSNDNVSEIREKIKAGEKKTDIAKEYGVSAHTIWRIDTGDLYAWL